ncbi:hypothetical protein NDU88_006415 [Pleurodeles waltl]|uniref:DDE Tnp4 domain-containing protein n=1 Tax=Pleurodeles waltl TaxID=8319 RepID=A0AAV7MC53_PLEWA|nr:hypothetical protein NDU88_006415 [Pleurodeles waltl]
MWCCTAVVNRLPQQRTTPAELPPFNLSLLTGQASAISGGHRPWHLTGPVSAPFLGKWSLPSGSGHGIGDVTAYVLKRADQSVVCPEETHVQLHRIPQVEDLATVKADFYAMGHIHNIIGAIDDTHIAFVPPPEK